MLYSAQTFLAGATLFTSLLTLAAAEDAEIKFDKCVTECVAGAGCAWNEPECMCKSARTGMLDSVASCMYFHCVPELRHFDETFLDIVVAGCEALGNAIPEKNVESADSSAKLFLLKLPAVSTISVATSGTSSTAKVAVATSATSEKTSEVATTMTKVAKATETTSADLTKGTATGKVAVATSTGVEETAIPSAVTSVATEAIPTSAQTTLALATGSPSVKVDSDATGTSSAGQSESTDSSPFAASPDSGAMRSVSSWVWASLPIVAALVMR